MHAKTQKDKRTKGQRNKYHSAHYKAVVFFVFLSFCVSIQIDYRGVKPTLRRYRPECL